ncbi:MAG TPA: hypothetical protein VFT22_28970, partial [Kofleriaceae bacterium]|nr:hypothetical protein [Kofleriaceae bacterium]
MIASGLVVAAIVLPWLTLLPLHGSIAVVAQALTLTAALHGAGLAVARLARQPAASPLVGVQWGVAALIGLSGLAIALHAGTLATHAVLLFGFAAVHTGCLGLRFTRYAERVAAQLTGARAWLAPAALLAALGALAVLGAAANPWIRPFDDESHVLAQLRRVLSTGALDDPIGYPRAAQLGAQIALSAIASGSGDGFTRILEPLAMVLALGLAVSRIRAAGAGSAMWAALLVVAAFALALAPTDFLPCWTAVGLIVALYATLSEPGPPALPIGLIAGALLALRHELAPIAVVAVVAAWSQRRAAHRATAILIGGALAVALPFLLARVAAWHAVPQLARAALAPPARAALVVRALLTLAIAAPATSLLRLIVPDSRELRWPAIATAVALGALAAQLTGAGPYAMRMAWPI